MGYTQKTWKIIFILPNFMLRLATTVLRSTENKYNFCTNPKHCLVVFLKSIDFNHKIVGAAI